MRKQKHLIAYQQTNQAQYQVGLYQVKYQKINDNEVHARYVYPIITERRDELKVHLEENNIETKIMHFPLACDAEVYKQYNKHPLPQSYKLIKQNLIIPSHEKLSEEDLNYMLNTINLFFKS